MAKDHGSSVKDDKQYEGLKKKGMSKGRAAKIANTSNASEKGGKRSGSGKGSSQSSPSGGSGSGGNRSQKQAAGRKGGKKSSERRRDDRRRRPGNWHQGQGLQPDLVH